MKKKLNIIFIFALLSFILFRLCFAGNQETVRSADILPGVVYAKLKSGINQATIQALSRQIFPDLASIQLKKAFPSHDQHTLLANIFKIEFDKKIPLAEVVAKLKHSGMFDYVEPKYISYIFDTVPLDSLISNQFFLPQIDMFRAWDIQTSAPDMVIAIVDNGTDYVHPDLAGNIWKNRIEALGAPGIDDDENDYIDDIYGWDFGENDNNPTFGTQQSIITVHGTHTAGIVAAMTNNLIGVAGVCWECQIMVVKVSTDDDTYSIPFGYEGIVYAADNGADIINNSWGRSGKYSQFEQDVINYAASKGCLIVAAGGNTYTETICYPAGYTKVIAVAAVKNNDCKSSYSSYGSFIDISAPGGDIRGIFSLYPVAYGSYGELSGTSMASPMVAGVMTLLRKQFPDFSRLQLTRQIVLTADNIDQHNPDYAGKIGFGRVNGFRALSEEITTEEPAKISFIKAAANDSNWGNHNFLFERNEIIGVDVWYRNFAVSSGHNVNVVLSTTDSDLVIMQNSVTAPEFPPDTVLDFQKQFNFLIKGDAKPHLAELALCYSLDNGIGGSDSLYVLIGESSVLLIDDDNGRRNVEGFYTHILKNFQVPYLRWDHAQLGTPPAETLQHFPLLIWFCEWAFPSLDPDDRLVLQRYLDYGGSLFISGQDIGWDLADPAADIKNQYSEETEQFYRQYLHSYFQSDNSFSSDVVGMPGSIGQGLNFPIYQPRIAFHFQFPDWIKAAEDARLCFQYDKNKGAGVLFLGEHNVLNLGFGFEAIAASQNASDSSFSRLRNEMMFRVLEWLGPISHRQNKDLEAVNQPVPFTAEVSPLITNLIQMSLYYKTENMAAFLEMPMANLHNSVYEQTINFSDYAGKVDYFFELKTAYYNFFLPANFSVKPFQFSIGEDITPPEIFHLPLQNVILQNSSRKVDVAVEDNGRVDSNSVWLHYGAWLNQDSLKMLKTANGSFETSLPPFARIADTVDYFISASDLALPPNRSVSDIYHYKIGREDFELGSGFWRADSGTWDLDDREFHSTMYSMSTYPGQSYPKNVNISLQLKFGILRKQLADIKLNFWTKYDIEENKDFGLVEMSTNNGSDWIPVGQLVTGRQNTWTQSSCDLNPFYEDNEDSVFLQFRFLSDSSQLVSMAGWFIDDVEFFRTDVSDIRSLEINNRQPSSLKLLPNFPNPFNAATQIQYFISKPGFVSLEIFNTLGQCVVNSLLGYHDAGRYFYSWHGRTSAGEECRSGIYFFRLHQKLSNQKSSYSNTIKMIYLK